MWIIKDWANNLMFDKEFRTFEKADEYLCNFLESNNMPYEEWIDEYWIRNVEDCKQ